MTTIDLLLTGGPTVRFGYAGLTFLTDPTFDEPRSYPGSPLTKLTGPALAADALGPIDVVLLSHDQHPDNLDVSGAALLADVPTVLSTPLAAERQPGVTGLAPWQETTVGPVTVTAVPALHGPPGAEARSGPVTGFVLAAAGWPTVYVAGDNASVPVVAQIADRFPEIEIAVLFVGAARVLADEEVPRTLDAGRALAAAYLLDAAVVVPVHAEGWAHFSESVDDVVRVFTAAGQDRRLRLLPKGERVEVTTGAPAAVPV